MVYIIFPRPILGGRSDCMLHGDIPTVLLFWTKDYEMLYGKLVESEHASRTECVTYVSIKTKTNQGGIIYFISWDPDIQNNYFAGNRGTGTPL